jgi:hypothetical protein
MVTWDKVSLQYFMLEDCCHFFLEHFMSNLTGVGVMIQHALKGGSILYIKEDLLSVCIDNDISTWFTYESKSRNHVSHG